MHKVIKICLMFIILITAMFSHAEIYKWIDEDGRTIYGDKPPDDNASKLDISNSPATVEKPMEERLEKRDKLLEIYEEERNLKKEQKLKAEQEEKQKKTRCIQLADRIKSIERGGIYYKLNENGEREYLSNETIAKAKKELEETFNKECK